MNRSYLNPFFTSNNFSDVQQFLKQFDRNYPKFTRNSPLKFKKFGQIYYTFKQK